jgi:hypothetical protein
MLVSPSKAIPLNPPSLAKGEVDPAAFRTKGGSETHPLPQEGGRAQRGGMLVSPPKAILLDPPSRPKGEVDPAAFRTKGESETHPLPQEGGRAQRGGMLVSLPKAIPLDPPSPAKGEENRLSRDQQLPLIGPAAPPVGKCLESCEACRTITIGRGLCPPNRF